MKVLGLLLQQRHQVFRLRVTWITSRHEDHIHARQLPKNFAPFVQRELDRFRVGVIAVHRRIPNPDIQAVGIGHARHACHHFHLWSREMLAVGGII